MDGWMNEWINGWMEREGRRGIQNRRYTNSESQTHPLTWTFSKARISELASWNN